MKRETRDSQQGEAGAGAERELKFVADRKVLKAALAAPLLGGEAASLKRNLRTVYFDTADGALARAKVALRARRADGGWILGVKRAATADRGAFEREETEVVAPNGDPDLGLLGASMARELTELTGGEPLAEKFGSDIRRASRTIEANGAAIEIAFDQGFLFAGEKRAPAAEIELELKSGDPAALFDLGLALVEAFPVRLEIRSKAERAHALIAAAPPEPVRADEPALAHGTTLDEAIAVVLRNGLAHFLANLPALASGDKVEAVHQMRVAMRRLRSALNLFGRAVPSAEFEALGAESKRFAAVLGEARDWDVFVERLRDGALARFAGEPGFDALRAAAETRSAEGHDAVARLAGDKAVARFALRVERLAAARGWRNGAADEALAALDGRAEAFASEALERLDRRVRKRGRRFRSLTPEARHALRIAMKHMRYATEFFGVLFPSKSAADRYVRKAAALQDLLGELNDAAIAVRLVKTLRLPKDPSGAYAAGVATGWCARESAGDPEARRKAWRALVRATPFWRT